MCCCCGGGLLLLLSPSFFLCYFLIKIGCGVVVFIPSTPFFHSLPSPPSLSLYSYLFSSPRLFSTPNSSNGFSLDRCIHETTHCFFCARSFGRSYSFSVSVCAVRDFTFLLRITQHNSWTKVEMVYTHLYI